ncbi:hypothetical protein [Robiginitalea marina]|uniref:Glycine zipper 2TM domain-containing protein n=1 Tax=Robiginitalea marina TaxID=2954105 RepID=A0ABT1AWX5_9FLAO|nr:hypothetical protein [Robiginitalea marina]MCO5724132.1 hypothetical protein [Robiginitalea marina]
MKCLLFPILFLFGSPLAIGQVTFDEKLHFGAGIVAGAAGGFVAHKISKGDKWWTIAGAVGTSLVAGVAKEAIDEAQDGDWDNRELAATALGGVVVGVTIEIFSGKKKKKKAGQIP